MSETSDLNNLRIVGLRTENIMRLRAVEVKPGPDGVIVIGGYNGEGKTSLLESIVMALGGTKAMPEQPVRRGQKAAIVVLDLGDIIVTRSFKEDQSSQLEVKSKEGARFSSPQKLLESLVGRVAFDPIHFLNLDAAKQLATLKEIVKLDFTELDKRYANAYGLRTDVNRDLTSLKGKLDGMLPLDDSLPKEEQDAVELSRKLAEAETADERLNELEVQGRDAATLVNETKEKIASLEKELEDTKAKLVSQEGRRETLRHEYASKKKEFAGLDSTAIHKQLTEITDTNKRIRNNASRLELEGQVMEKEEALLKLEKELGDVSIAKEKAMTAAKFPIPGLSFNDHGVLYCGVPFDQASGADKLRTSLAMGIALNPKIRVMVIRDGSLLDDRNLDIVRKMAKESGVQVWVERVGHGEECSVIIDDGEVLEDRIAEPEKAKAPKTKTTVNRRPLAGPRSK